MSARTLPLKLRKQLQAIATPVLKEKGTVLFRFGQSCCGAFLVRRGQVKLSIQGSPGLYPETTVGPGSVLGLPATFSGEPYSLTAASESKCCLDFIPRRRLLALLHRNPDAGCQVLRLLSEEIFRIRKVVKNGGRSRRYSPAIA